MESSSNDGVSVHGGFPNPAVDSSLPTLDFNKLLVQHIASTYTFRIEGAQWEDAGVFDGDIAIVDRALDARPSDVVVWWNEQHGEFAISKQTAMPRSAALWGVITATIHQHRKPGNG